MDRARALKGENWSGNRCSQWHCYADLITKGKNRHTAGPVFFDPETTMQGDQFL